MRELLRNLVRKAMLIGGGDNSCCNLHRTYRKGNVIKQNVQPLPSGFQSSLLFGHDPVIIGQNTPGAGSLFPLTREESILNASVVASGFSATPDDLDTFALSTMGPGNITLQGSGTSGQPASHMTLWTGKTPFGGKFAAVVADGDFTVSGGDSLTLNQSEPGGSMLLESQGQITFAPHGASGLVRYEMGPGPEGLYIRTSSSQDFKHIPDECRVREIICEMVSGVK